MQNDQSTFFLFFLEQILCHTKGVLSTSVRDTPLKESQQQQTHAATEAKERRKVKRKTKPSWNLR